MRLPIVWTIYRKELTEALRDRITLLVLVGLPMLIYPLALFTTIQVSKHQAAAEDRRVFNIAVWGVGATPLVDWLCPATNRLTLERWLGVPPPLREALEADRWQPPTSTNTPSDPPALRVGERSLALNTEPDDPMVQAARETVSRKQADAVLLIWPGFDDAVQQHDAARLTVYYDSVIPSSSQAWSRLSQLLGQYREHLRQERQRARGLPEGFVQTLQIRGGDVAPVQRQVSNLLGRMLPVVLMMLAMVGALVAAADMTAGEKDRATMQTLLCAPVRSLEIVGGKFLAVWTISVISAVANLTGVALIIGRVATLLHGEVVHWGALAGALGLLLPATWTIAALFLAVAVLARDVKDAGNFLGVASLAVMLLVSIALLPGVELDAGTCWVPLVNLALLIRALLTEQVSAPLIGLTLLASLGYAGLTLTLAARVFGREQNLLGGPVSWRALWRGRKTRVAVPTPGLALLMFALAVAAMFYLGLWFAPRGLLVTLLATQYGALLLPAVAVAWLRRFPLAETFALRRPHWRSVLGAVLIGLSAAVALAGLVLRFAPPPEALVREMQDLLSLGGAPLPLWQLMLLIAITPALCEETLFRGLLFSGLRRWGPGAAIGLTALGFALLHANIYRLLPTFLLGLVLGYAVWRSGSLYCSILIHGLNNGLVAVVLWSSQGQEFEVQSVPWGLTLGALAVTGLGLSLIRPPAAEPAGTSPSAANTAA